MSNNNYMNDNNNESSVRKRNSSSDAAGSSKRRAVVQSESNGNVLLSNGASENSQSAAVVNAAATIIASAAAAVAVNCCATCGLGDNRHTCVCGYECERRSILNLHIDNARPGALCESDLHGANDPDDSNICLVCGEMLELDLATKNKHFAAHAEDGLFWCVLCCKSVEGRVAKIERHFATEHRNPKQSKVAIAVVENAPVDAVVPAAAAVVPSDVPIAASVAAEKLVDVPIAQNDDDDDDDVDDDDKNNDKVPPTDVVLPIDSAAIDNGNVAMDDVVPSMPSDNVTPTVRLLPYADRVCDVCGQKGGTHECKCGRWHPCMASLHVHVARDGLCGDDPHVRLLGVNNTCNVCGEVLEADRRARALHLSAHKRKKFWCTLCSAIPVNTHTGVVHFAGIHGISEPANRQAVKHVETPKADVVPTKTVVGHAGSRLRGSASKSQLRSINCATCGSRNAGGEDSVCGVCGDPPARVGARRQRQFWCVMCKKALPPPNTVASVREHFKSVHRTHYSPSGDDTLAVAASTPRAAPEKPMVVDICDSDSGGDGDDDDRDDKNEEMGDKDVGDAATTDNQSDVFSGAAAGVISYEAAGGDDVVANDKAKKKACVASVTHADGTGRSRCKLCKWTGGAHVCACGYQCSRISMLHAHIAMSRGRKECAADPHVAQLKRACAANARLCSVCGELLEEDATMREWHKSTHNIGLFWCVQCCQPLTMRAKSVKAHFAVVTKEEEEEEEDNEMVVKADLDNDLSDDASPPANSVAANDGFVNRERLLEIEEQLQGLTDMAEQLAVFTSTVHAQGDAVRRALEPNSVPRRHRKFADEVFGGVQNFRGAEQTPAFLAYAVVPADAMVDMRLTSDRRKIVLAFHLPSITAQDIASTIPSGVPMHIQQALVHRVGHVAADSLSRRHVSMVLRLAHEVDEATFISWKVTRLTTKTLFFTGAFVASYGRMKNLM
jgi:hypothetical protein